MDFKKITGTVKANPIGVVAGGAAGYFLAKKYMPANKYAMVGGVLVGLLVGAYASSAIKAKGAPTKTEVKK